jgi:hypothetical protein
MRKTNDIIDRHDWAPLARLAIALGVVPDNSRASMFRLHTKMHALEALGIVRHTARGRWEVVVAKLREHGLHS